MSSPGQPTAEQGLSRPSRKTSSDFWDEAEYLGRALVDCLDYFEALGVGQLPARLAPPPPARPAATGARPTDRPAPTAPRAAQAPPAARPAPQSSERLKRPASTPTPAEEQGRPEIWAPAAAGLADLDRLIERCSACPLGLSRPADPVPGRGSARPLMVVVGPTPAIYEGPNGELLTAMIEKGLKLGPEDYYVTSLVKCLPPAETEAALDRADTVCRPFLMRQLALLAPKMVLALGKKPGQRLSGLKGEPLGLMRPRSHKVLGLEDIWLRITYGLEDILSAQEIKEATWQDLLRIRPGLHQLKVSLKTG